MNELQKEFEVVLKNSLIDFSCQKIGLNFYQLFIEPLSKKQENHYKEYNWIIKQSTELGYTINAVPPSNLFDKLPWEEWFLLEGKKCHYILYIENFNESEGNWSGKENDINHPKEVLGRTWYYKNCECLKPLFF